MVESMTDKDFETLAGSFTGDDVLKLVHGDLIESGALVTKKLIRHPGLMKILLKYLK